jgi:SpoVK/Ycf46/Vps4 family AAA+-type ATPase
VEVVTGANLLSRFMGNTGPNVVEAMRRAKGGILFIDEAYGIAPRHGSYGAEAIQALIDNITLPEFRGNLIIILGGYQDDVEQLFESNAGFRSRFDKRRIEFPSWTAQMATNATIKQIAKDGLSITAEAQELLPHMYEQLSSLPEWGSARDVYRNILPAMYSKRSKRLAAIARMEKVDAEAAASGPGGLSVDTGISASQHKRGQRHQSSATAPYTAMDVRDAFESSLKTRGRKVNALATPQVSSASIKKKKQPRPAFLPLDPAQGGQGAEQSKVNIKQNVTVRMRKVDDGDAENSGWDAASVFAALEEACAELGYSLDKIEEILTSGKYPPELIELVVLKSGCSDVTVLVEILNSQKASFLAKIVALKKLNAQAKSAAEMKVQAKIRHIGKCPMNFDWIKIPGGYQCTGGTHFLSDMEIDLA